MKFITLFFALLMPLMSLAQDAPSSVRKNIVAPNLVGEADLKFFGLKVYHISLWGEDKNFSYEKKFAIHIRYNMNFSKEEMAKRSIEEIERLHQLSDDERSSYYQKLEGIFSAVKKGDEKTAIFTPNHGVALFYNGEISGIISDEKLARFFVDIWLDERGSYPKVTRKILGKNY